MKITINNLLENINTDYLTELLQDNLDENDEIELDIFYMSQLPTSSYGNWTTSIEINHHTYTMRHNNEDWYLSQNHIRNEEYTPTEDDYKAFQLSFDRTVEYKINEIITNEVN